jgi:hypothetical protein
MKLRQYVQAVAYCTVVLGAPLAGAADVDYTSAEQRLRDLELRLNSLETASYNEPSGNAGCDACGSNCGDGCNSCGSGVGCGSGCDSGCGGCGGNGAWLCPDPSCYFLADLLFFQANSGDLNIDGIRTQNSGQPATRFTFGRLNSNGRSFRIRYFNYDHTLDTDPNFGVAGRLNMETLDFELGRRFTLGGRLRGEFNGGIRWTQLQAFSPIPFNGGGTETILNYDHALGPVVGLNLRGRQVLRGESFLNLRQAWMFGTGISFGDIAPGTFTISEVQFGLQWERQVRMGTLIARTMFEAQSWNDGYHGSIGLVGGGFGFGLAR